jgi:1,4-dihydroxy-6-naphthoate synthase
MNTPRKISLAYSPDSDDAFMVHALRTGAVSDPRWNFDFVVDDIQRLNEAARRGVHDITAISVAAWPGIADTYDLMPVGASIGDGYGPAVVVAQTSNAQTLSDLAGRRIAVPGLATSAYFSAMILTGGFTAVPMHFLEIAGAVQSGAVDAGLLIHERQLDPAQLGVRRITDLGTEWQKRFELPLPLGANAIRRSLGPEAIDNLTQLYRASIEWGLAHRSSTLSAALDAAITSGIDMASGDRYISMYVNDNSLDFDQAVRKSISLLFSRAQDMGLCKTPALSF